MSYASLLELEAAVAACRQCPRLVAYREEIGRTKVRRHLTDTYWARGVPGWGDPTARALIVGLAPAAHGSNRTGRMFTGDLGRSWLYEALHTVGLAALPTSTHAGDRQALSGVYITAAGRCAPPQNKPTPAELRACQPFLSETIRLLPTVRVYLLLGRVAYQAFGRATGWPLPPFAHGARGDLPEGRTVVCSYHPSRQNSQTGRLAWPSWLANFEYIAQAVHAP